MSRNDICPDCGDLMCFHSGTVCPLKTHRDAFEKLKKENAGLRKKLSDILTAVDNHATAGNIHHIHFLNRKIEKIVGEFDLDGLRVQDERI